MGVDGDQADGSSIAHPPQTLDHPGGFQAQTLVGQRFGQHDLVRFRAQFLAGRHDPFGLGAAVGRHDPVFRAPRLVDTQHATGSIGHAAHRARFVAAGTDRAQARQHPLPRRQSRPAGRFRGHQDQRWLTILVFPGHGTRDRIAVTVGAGDLHDRGFGQDGAGRPARPVGSVPIGSVPAGTV